MYRTIGKMKAWTAYCTVLIIEWWEYVHFFWMNDQDKIPTSVNLATFTYLCLTILVALSSNFASFYLWHLNWIFSVYSSVIGHDLPWCFNKFVVCLSQLWYIKMFFGNSRSNDHYDELWSLHYTSGATYMMTSHVSSALWTLLNISKCFFENGRLRDTLQYIFFSFFLFW